MSTGVFLSYKGLGANLLHLSYCHEIAKRYGPIEIITLSKNLEQALEKDPLIKKITYLNQYHKKIIDIYKLAKNLGNQVATTEKYYSKARPSDFKESLSKIKKWLCE